ncbi:hypothetical protein KC207_06800 [Phycicoccus sp. BSK3Z-2]|uniref:NERD domain-containing protein n=1 Tax=Phycicoccus avicenniae TaxID=2828860 RepID=A0A941D6G7_9MICO|nr:hypothetical protein [Phycicoccus avicenniae]MBR7742994.1 hypothetical protein [Phycicoccus avicenniae]
MSNLRKGQRRAPSEAQRRAVQDERASRAKVPLLERTGLDVWADWFRRQEHPFAQAWGEFFPGPDERAVGFAPDAEAVGVLTELAPSAREFFLGEQSAALDAATKALRRIDSLPLLALMLFLQRFSKWGASEDPSEVPDDLDYEIACQIVAGQGPTENVGFNPRDVIGALNLLGQVRYLAYAVNIADGFMPRGEPSAAIAMRDEVVRNRLLARRLVWRGSAYPSHDRELVRWLGAAHGPAMIERLGFDVADYAAVADALVSHLRDSVSEAVEKALESADAVAAAAPESRRVDARRFAFIIAAHEWIVPAVAPSVADVRARLDEPTRSRLGAVLMATGLRPGDGAPLRSVLDEPAARDRPFMLFPSPTSPSSNGERLLVADSGALLTDMASTVESLMSRTFGQRWPAARARAVDGLAVDLLASLLPGARVHTSVHIDAPDGSGRFEMDGLVLFEDMALFVEGKGAPFKLAGRRGSVDSYRGQVRDLLGHGVEQLARDARLLDGGPIPLLTAQGQTVGLLDPASVHRSFQVLPCFDDLGDIGTARTLLEAWGLVDPGQHPWIVAVTDMAVVVDALHGPAQLVGYLEWRERWGGESRLMLVEEIEMFVLYQRAVDVQAKLRDAGSENLVMFASGQPAFDDYYSGLEGTGPVSPAPRLRLTPRFRRFADELTRLRPPGWLGAASAAVQAPESVQLACDDRSVQRSGASAVGSRGAVVSGDTEFAVVTVGPDLSWQDAYKEYDLARRYMQCRFVLFFRARGSRLRMEWACRGSDSSPPPRWSS